MSCPFNEEQLEQLKAFIELCRSQPQILQHPRLSFFKEYLVTLGVTLPTATFGTKHFTPSGDKASNNNEAAAESSSEETEPESDVELDMEGVVEGDAIDNDQIMGDPGKEPTDEERDQSDEKRSEAMKAFSEQNLEDAIKLYTEAIQLNPQSALLFAKRGQVYLKSNKPNACIKDCTHALELNCDSAAAYKFRGRAYRLLGKFEEASHDLCESLKIDYDDQTNEWLSEIKPNAEKLRQHKLSVQRKKEEKEHREKLRRLRKAQEAAKAQEKQNKKMPDMPDSGFCPNDLRYLLTDPELSAIFKDKEILDALQDMSVNPGNFFKYQSNPKIAEAFKRYNLNLAREIIFSVRRLQISVLLGRVASSKINLKSANPPHADKGKPADDDVGLD